MLRSARCIVALLLPLVLTAATAAQRLDWPAGRHLQRSLALLADDLPAPRPAVRILYYGQSITQRSWTDLVTESLRTRFPSTPIIAENRAIGGFAADRLIRTTEADVIGFQPDLVIFHVYGAEDTYESLIQLVRSRTTAEILLMSDHATWEPEPGFEVDARKLESNRWHDRHTHWLRDLATRARLGFVDIRAGFREHAAAHGITLRSLTSDGTHLNAEGSTLMARLVGDALVRDRNQPAGVPDDAVATLPAGSLHAADGRALTVSASFTRADVIFHPGAGTHALHVLVDGRSPSAWDSLRHHGRTTLFRDAYNGAIPPLFRVGWRTPPTPQTWTATITETFGEKGPWSFRVEGGLTGADGSGRTDQPFISSSGQVVIEPGDWNLTYASWANKRPVTPGFTARWQTVATGSDTLAPPPPTPGEAAVTAVYDLPPGSHTLELRGPADALAQVAAIRLYRPAAAP